MSLGTKYSTVSTAHSWISCIVRLQHHPTVAALLKTLNISKRCCGYLRSTIQTHTVSCCISLGNWFPLAAADPGNKLDSRVHSLMFIQNLYFSVTGWGSRGTSSDPQGHQEPAAQDHVQKAFEYLQGWRFHNLLDNLCQCLVTLPVESTLQSCFPAGWPPAYIHFASPGAFPLYKAELYNLIMVISFIW